MIHRTWSLLYISFADITSLLAELTPQQKTHECVAFALKLRTAWALSNYTAFFRLYKNAPLMSTYLVDWFKERERKTAIKIIVKGYVITLSFAQVHPQLQSNRFFKFLSWEIRLRFFLTTLIVLLFSCWNSSLLQLIFKYLCFVNLIIQSWRLNCWYLMQFEAQCTYIKWSTI